MEANTPTIKYFFESPTLNFHLRQEPSFATSDKSQLKGIHVDDVS